MSITHPGLKIDEGWEAWTGVRGFVDGTEGGHPGARERTSNRRDRGATTDTKSTSFFSRNVGTSVGSLRSSACLPCHSAFISFSHAFSSPKRPPRVLVSQPGLEACTVPREPNCRPPQPQLDDGPTTHLVTLHSCTCSSSSWFHETQRNKKSRGPPI